MPESEDGGRTIETWTKYFPTGHSWNSPSRSVPTLQFSFTPTKLTKFSASLTCRQREFWWILFQLSSGGPVPPSFNLLQFEHQNETWMEAIVEWFPSVAFHSSRGRFKETIHRFNFLNHFASSPVPNLKGLLSLKEYVSIQIRWSSNCSDNQRILMKPLQIDELKSSCYSYGTHLRLFFQDRILSMNPLSDLQFQEISTEDSEGKTGKSGLLSASSQPFILSSLVQSKPMESITLERSIHVLC